MARNHLVIAALATFVFVPAARAVKCPNGQTTREVYVRLKGCANVPKEFLITINGTTRTITRPNDAVAEWHVKVSEFCIPETNLTSIEISGFHTACNVASLPTRTTLAPVAIYEVPCAPIWELVVEKAGKSESKFGYGISRDPILTCPHQENGQELIDSKAPDSIGDLALEDGVEVEVIAKGKLLRTTVKEKALRSKPKGATFGYFYKSSSARNKQTDEVRNALADRVDLMFKKEQAK